MTTYEHAMLGVNGALAFNLHHKHGWKIIALAGFAATSPDWDGLPFVVSKAIFIEGHRLWGHNLLGCLLIGILIGGSIIDLIWLPGLPV